MSIFEIEADICKARTLSSEFYTGERHFERSKEAMFARTWQFAGTDEEFEGLRPITLLPGFLDEPLLLAKTGERVSCLSNVCTHRGKILVEEPCAPHLIRCAYHGRRFALDGKFLSMPEFEGVENFPSETDDLRQIPFARQSGFVFASLNPVVAFKTFSSGMAAMFGDSDAGAFELASRRDYELNAHWALYCENYLEGFHIPYVHHGLNAIVDYGSYTTETFRYSSLQTAFDETGEIAARYFFMFPNLMLNFYPWGISVNIVRPVSPSRTIVEFLSYVSDSSKLDSGAGADLHSVELEDEAVVESVQQGIRSRFYTHGRYSPAREKGTHHFHRLIAEFMA